ncbi:MULTISPECIES: HAD family hydrolase [Pseudomonadaceae]|uniref:HAD family hydrolase n=1 Tax=Metapseudomonas otitidis TaxID=319939 RepID=A0A679GQY7_9GAMM|nr:MULTISPECIES: HAD family hydrolase [Pseudomonas]MBO2929922.1 HAD family hydrolase [Pseudomonas otitidis]MCO7555781.1 HAD-IB family hydrolase [Pseudomonas otitidis]MCP1621090.1 HAD superfamily hydrolase (TIGR01490 family) [Pseudomonas otitidis]MDI6527946.1 HAD family hydrolase [Pseudomonas otitidis]MDU9397736.1 HAD family hydrolase [Pseudomonas sp. zfem003]
MALAIFDLDDTLIDGDCASLWSAHMADLGWVDRDSFLARDHELMTLYAEGKLAMEDYMAFSLSPLVGRTAEEVASVVEPFVEDVIEPIIHSDAMRCLAGHRQAGDRLLIISASAHFLVSAIGERLGVEEVLAIDLAEEHGHYSGKTRGVLTYRDGKVTRLNAWLAEHGERLDGAYFYSDSRNDLPLLGMVDNPRVVNPDPVLRAHAEQAGWPILAWR